MFDLNHYNDLNTLSFDQDENGAWGYKVGGADTVIPFKSNSGSDTQLISSYAYVITSRLKIISNNLENKNIFAISGLSSGFNPIQLNDQTLVDQVLGYGGGNYNAYYFYRKNLTSNDVIKFNYFHNDQLVFISNNEIEIIYVNDNTGAKYINHDHKYWYGFIPANNSHPNSLQINGIGYNIFTTLAATDNHAGLSIAEFTDYVKIGDVITSIPNGNISSGGVLIGID